jgi:hypothetical protein
MNWDSTKVQPGVHEGEVEVVLEVVEEVEVVEEEVVDEEVVDEEDVDEEVVDEEVVEEEVVEECEEVEEVEEVVAQTLAVGMEIHPPANVGPFQSPTR